MNSPISLNQFLQQLSLPARTDSHAQNHRPEQIQSYEQTQSGLYLVVQDIIKACKRIAVAVNKGALSGTMGELDSQNIQGEQQKQMDVISNEIFLQCCQVSGYVAGMVSEEMDDPYDIAAHSRLQGNYLVLFDPLDGSSNVNLNISVGTIFSVLRCPAGIEQPTVQDFLQPGTQQVCAGYAMYGSSTMLVLTTGNGVNGFTLDHSEDHAAGEFFLTHPQMQIPADTREFAINMSNQRFWQAPVQRYIAECLQGKEGARQKDFNMRWVASMVAEVHRVLVRGGVFLYPVDTRIQQQGGKLRLMYEANPMAFIVEQAGGAASTGLQRILDVMPAALHQRVAVMLGSRNEIDRLNRYHAEGPI